ncbi:DUF2849 domain-containing protein [Elstera litoralis]|uniref:DUF2849 domain-containing protein n=1 Tax=Elstera litoralis TaxID=552518 RepID=UPI000695DC64|nr:DUF2849 domain-containing protein [Elstera litoralis]
MSATPRKVTSAAPRLLTANRLRDGAVIFFTGKDLATLTQDGFGPAWSLAIADAPLFSLAEAETLLAIAVQNPALVGPYLVEADATAHGPRPLKMRERIRGEGPTVDIPTNPASLTQAKAA